MTNIEKKTIETPLGVKRSYYYDRTNNRDYRRICGGVAWPHGDQPGFLCVISEDDNTDPRLRLRHYWILTEFENKDVDRLVKRMYDLQNRYLISQWYGDTDNVLMMHFVDRFNRRLSRKKKGIYISEAAFVGETHNLRLYAHQVQSLTKPERKSLYFGKQSQIPGHLSSLSPDDVQKKKAEDFPVIAALGYCLSGLDEPYIDQSKDRELHAQFVNQRMVEGL